MWIFFDCFNTLLDDFDETGDESGVGPISHFPVDAGFYPSPEHFYRDYTAWRRRQWPGRVWREVILPDRLKAVLTARNPSRREEVESLVEAMLDQLKEGYPELLRPTPGVHSMLDAWRGKARLGVVSNFFLPGWPEKFLATHGLAGYFDFVLDSAAFGWKKPGVRIYCEALHLAGLSSDQAGDVLFVGDSLTNDVLTPRKLGFRTLYLDRSSDRPLPPAPDDVDAIAHWDQFRADG